MSEISKIEDSLLAVLDGRAPEAGWNAARFGGHRAFGEVGSFNWQPLQDAVALRGYGNRLGGNLFPRSQGWLILWWIDFFHHQLGIRIIRPGGRGFMGGETMSPIYDQVTFASVVSVWAWARGNGHEELRDLAARWIRARLIAGALVTFPVAPRNRFFDGAYPRTGPGWSCPCAGARGVERADKVEGSHAKDGDPMWLDSPPRATWLIPYVLGQAAIGDGFLGDVIRRVRPTWTSFALKTELQDLVQGHRVDAIAGLPPIRGSIRIRRTTQGISTWAESTEGWSFATAHLEGTTVTDDGLHEYLASNDGSRARIHQATASLIGDRIVSSREVSHDMWLGRSLMEPPDRRPWISAARGDLLWDIRWDHTGAHQIGTGTGGSMPVPPPGPSDPWLTHRAIVLERLGRPDATSNPREAVLNVRDYLVSKGLT